MSFVNDIKYVMNNDPSICGWIDGSIGYERLNRDFNLTQKWLLYYFKKNEQVNSMNNKKIYTNYELYTIIITPKNEDMLTKSNRLVEYLNGQTYQSVVDISFYNDDHAFDNERNVYTNTLTFNVIGE